MRIPFFLIFLAGTLLIFVYFRQVTRKVRTSIIATAIIAVVAISYMFTRRYAFLDNWTLVASIFLGLWAVLFAGAMLYLAVLYPCQKLWPSIFMARTIRKTYLTLNFIYFFIALILGSKYPRIKKVELEIPELPSLKLVQLSDIHIDTYNSGHYLENIVKKVNKLSPDLVVITGDMVDIDPSRLDPFFEILDKLDSKLGVYYSLGNHERYSRYLAIMDALNESKSKIIPLINDLVTLDNNGLFNLVGINDPSITSFSESLQVIDYNIPSIIMSHRPTVVYSLENPVALVLSGHTHGGQFFPFNIVVRMVDQYVYGIYHTDKGILNVSAGTGTWGPPLRFPRGNEIVFFEIN